jgi:hypothetical protein
MPEQPTMPRWTQEDDWDDDEVESDEFDNEDDGETVSCPHCRRRIYEGSERCTHCEKYISEEDPPAARKPWWIIIGALLVLLIVYLWIRR